MLQLKFRLKSLSLANNTEYVQYILQLGNETKNWWSSRQTLYVLSYDKIGNHSFSRGKPKCYYHSRKLQFTPCPHLYSNSEWWSLVLQNITDRYVCLAEVRSPLTCEEVLLRLLSQTIWWLSVLAWRGCEDGHGSDQKMVESRPPSCISLHLFLSQLSLPDLLVFSQNPRVFRARHPSWLQPSTRQTFQNMLCQEEPTCLLSVIRVCNSFPESYFLSFAVFQGTSGIQEC